VDLKLRSGGAITGEVIDHTDHGLVILANTTPHVFAWTELEGGSAYDIRRSLLVFMRGDVSQLTAEDHFELGVFALRQGRNDLAANAFRAAEKIDKRYRKRAEAAFAEFRARAQQWENNKLAFFDTVAAGKAEPELKVVPPGTRAAGADPHLPPELQPDTHPIPADVQKQVYDAYMAFGEKVREELGRDLELLESDHFLIWTDWPRSERPLLTRWAEAMYAALSHELGLAPGAEVFLAKCPMFCFQRPGRFRRFAQKFDGYSGKEAVGYTRSAEQTGHVHLVLVRQGDSQIDFERFATTLVHEGTHAFLHRLHSSALIPHWVNEGYADLMAERVLGEQSVTGENAALLARQYVKHDWPMGDMLAGGGPLAVHEYALAHSLIAYLDSLGEHRLARFIRVLKQGKSSPEALAESFDGLTMEQLERDWRAQLAAADSGAMGKQ
jgi:hypothetical protein